jgi:hypothetical protein
MDALNRTGPRVQLSPQDSRTKRAELAAQADAWGLYEAIRGEHHGQMDWDVEFDQLYAALQQRAHLNTDQFSDELFEHLLATGAYFLLRAEFLIVHTFKSADERGRRGKPYLPAHLIERQLPQLLELYKSVAEIASVRASTLRQLELGRAKRSENKGRVPETTGGRAKPVGGMHPSSIERTNGKAPATNGNGHAKQPVQGPINRLQNGQNGSHRIP